MVEEEVTSDLRALATTHRGEGRNWLDAAVRAQAMAEEHKRTGEEMRVGAVWLAILYLRAAKFCVRVVDLYVRAAGEDNQCVANEKDKRAADEVRAIAKEDQRAADEFNPAGDGHGITNFNSRSPLLGKHGHGDGVQTADEVKPAGDERSITIFKLHGHPIRELHAACWSG